jgi:hypothetical protein
MTLDVYADLFDEDLDGVADRPDTAIRRTADYRVWGEPSANNFSNV